VIEELFVVENMASDVARAAAAAGVTITEVSEHVMASLSDTTTPQGVVATARLRSHSTNELAARAGLLLLLAEVRDPGNAGTLVRSAAASGASGVIFARGSVDPLHPKTVRSSAGALFHIPVVRDVSVEEAVAVARSNNLTVIEARADSNRFYDGTDLTRPALLVLGNEAWGLPTEKENLIDERVGIPMSVDVESLNVGVAGSIILFEAARQRRLSSAAK
jgi:RNA methyltransferase, TrmH family